MIIEPLHTGGIERLLLRPLAHVLNAISRRALGALPPLMPDDRAWFLSQARSYVRDILADPEHYQLLAHEPLFAEVQISPDRSERRPDSNAIMRECEPYFAALLMEALGRGTGYLAANARAQFWVTQRVAHSLNNILHYEPQIAALYRQSFQAALAAIVGEEISRYTIEQSQSTASRRVPSGPPE